MDHYQHPQAIVESSNIGKRTQIQAFVHILPGAVIGEDCTICDHTFVEDDVRLGNRVTIKGGVQLWDGVTVEDDVFIGPNVTFTNTGLPLHNENPAYQQTIVHKGASIGANATILPGIEIGRSALIGAGAVVTRSVPPHAIVVGNPGRIIGYESAIASREDLSLEKGEDNQSEQVGVRGVRIIKLPLIHDLRGDLSFAQFPDSLPFVPKRYFLVFDVASKEIRGEHAHYSLHQFLVCVNGTCSVVVDDGTNREEIQLNRRELGLYLPPMVWGIQYKFSPDAVLMVLASDVYKAEDYIRNYDQFIVAVRKQGSSK